MRRVALVGLARHRFCPDPASTRGYDHELSRHGRHHAAREARGRRGGAASRRGRRATRSCRRRRRSRISGCGSPTWRERSLLTRSPIGEIGSEKAPARVSLPRLTRRSSRRAPLARRRDSERPGMTARSAPARAPCAPAARNAHTGFVAQRASSLLADSFRAKSPDLADRSPSKSAKAGELTRT